jgi:tetratricopeptide (TPR) repeat protein
MGNYQEAKKAIQKAIGNGGKESADILDHYGDILYALGEKEVAFIYWSQADNLDPSLNIAEKIKSKK